MKNAKRTEREFELSQHPRLMQSKMEKIQPDNSDAIKLEFKSFGTHECEPIIQYIRNWRDREPSFYANAGKGDINFFAEIQYKAWKRVHPDDVSTPEVDEMRLKEIRAILYADKNRKLEQHEFMPVKPVNG